MTKIITRYKMIIEGRRPERRAPLKKSLVVASVRNPEVP
tara:strand:- start:160 stop:276 length:117 start_codon:yes stop_codon:yes gene_type:complete